VDRIDVRSGEWVVVCDGRRALILENIGNARFPNLHTKEVREHPEPRTSEQGSDRPGKTHAPVGTARSAVEQTDWHGVALDSNINSLSQVNEPKTG
jgi:protein required for attachment to host cells